MAPGSTPTPLREVFEYSPTIVGLVLSAGIWAAGILVFTPLIRATIAIFLAKAAPAVVRPIRRSHRLLAAYRHRPLERAR